MNPLSPIVGQVQRFGDNVLSKSHTITSMIRVNFISLYCDTSLWMYNSMTTSKQNSKKVTKIARPTVGIDGINHAIRALYAYKDSATYKDLAKAADLHPVYLSRSLSASRDVGLTMSAGQRGLYKLTPEGEEYGRLLSYGKESECRQLLQKVILENPLWSEIIRFLRVSEGRETDPLSMVGDVEGKLGKRWSPSMRDSLANAYTSVLEYAKLITLKGGKMISQVEREKEIGVQGEKVGEEIGEKPTEEPMTGAAPVGYVEFKLPDSFILYVRKDSDAIEFFEKQVKKESILTPWIEFIRSKLEKEENG